MHSINNKALFRDYNVHHPKLRAIGQTVCISDKEKGGE